MSSSPAVVVIESGYRPGAIGAVTQLHGVYYAREAGFGQAFESQVAKGLAEFTSRLGHPRNGWWHAVRDGQLLGSIAIDGEHLPGNSAHLRWFIVGEEARGSGVGRCLIDTALAFCDVQSFDDTQLWTFNTLTAARRIYERSGFVLHQEGPGTQWGSEVIEQHFVRPRPARA